SKLNGSSGSDILVSGKGADTLTGSTGTVDIVSYETAAAGLVATLDTTNGGTNSGEAASDVFSGIEGLKGSDFNDTLWGWKAAASTLDGGKGIDALNGGSAGDTFVIDNAGDVI